MSLAEEGPRTAVFGDEWLVTEKATSFAGKSDEFRQG